ncbi:putative amidoligase domain-containing protein, partial [Cohnella lubricantis]|nr:hypothetical protein [Cohnella lubricantis]
MAGKVWANTYGEAMPWSRMPSGVQQLRPDSQIDADDAVLLFPGSGLPNVGQAGRAWIWNARAAAAEALEPREIERRLIREGFSAELTSAGHQAAAGRWHSSAGTVRYEYVFEVAVFGLGCAFVRPSPLGSYRGEQLTRRLKRASARALYILGLDMGMVKWKLDRTGRFGLIVGLTPQLSTRSAGERDGLRLAASAFAANWERETASGVSAVIGADPEFVLLAPSGKVVPASRFFPPQAPAGSDTVVVGGVLRRPLAELRPAPAA